MYQKKQDNSDDARVLSRPQQRAIIIAALQATPNGWQVYNRVGRKIGVSYGSIWNIAKSEGIKLIAFNREPHRLRLTQKNYVKVIATLKKNPNALLTAKKLNISYAMVQRIAKENGIELYNSRHASTKRYLKIVRALKHNPNASKIAKELRVNYHVVWRAARKADIELSKKIVKAEYTGLVHEIVPTKRVIK